jgi:hypothetical protein
MQRRVLLQGVLAAGAALSTTSKSNAEGRSAPSAPASELEGIPGPAGRGPQPDEVDAWRLFEPLAQGDEIGLGWRLMRLSDVTQGGVVLTLGHEGGAEARVHLCRKEGAGQGVAQSDGFDLFLMNHGSGSSPTDEALGRAIKTLARIIGDNERRGVTGPNVLPHSLRLCWYGRRELV